MTDDAMDQISRLLVDALGGQTPWVLLWSAADDDEGVMSSVPREDLPEMVCAHLFRLLRHELDPPTMIVSAH
jgi:hypothetical protein